jgi:hypothetical protein
MSNTTLFLTADEQKIFSGFSDALRDGWIIEPETSEVYESPEELAMRADISPLKRHPEVKKALSALQKGTDLEKIPFPTLSERDFAEFFFCIGARGTSAFLSALLQNAKTDEDLRAVASFSYVRHKLLESNASIRYV